MEKEKDKRSFMESFIVLIEKKEFLPLYKEFIGLIDRSIDKLCKTPEVKTSNSKSVGEKTVMSPEAHKHWDTEYKGISASHRNLHGIFVKMVSIYLTIATIPVTFIIALSHISKIENIAVIARAFDVICLIIGLAGILFSIILMHYRFLIVENARWLNSLRDTLQTQEGESWCKLAGLPTNRAYPSFYEPLREMGVLVIISAIINSFYFYLAFTAPSISLTIEILYWSLGSIAVHEIIYLLLSIAKQRKLLG